MSCRFLLFGLSQITSNFGCEALIRGTGVILKRALPDCQPVYISDGHARIDKCRLGASSPVAVEDSAPRFGPRFFCRRLMAKLGRTRRCRRPLSGRILRNADCVLSVGGDLYTFADEETEAVWPYPWPVVYDGNDIMDHGVPYVIWCASVGPLEKAGDRLDVLVEHLRRCTAVIVREETSYEYLTEVLSVKDNVYLAADPAYLMDPVSFNAPFLSESEDPTVAINMALGSIVQVYGNDEERIARVHEHYLEGMASLISDLGVRIVLVPHGVSDHAYLGGFYEHLRERYGERVWLVPEGLGAQRTKWVVSQCTALVAMRFHCALAGFGTCTPTMLVLTKPKGAMLVKDVYGSTDYSLDLCDFSREALRDMVEQMLDNRDSIRSTLQTQLKEMQRRALYAGDLLKQLL